MMNTKKIDSLLEQIETADLVQVADSPLLHSVNVDGLATDTESNEILMMKWSDDEGLEFMVKFTESNLNNANVIGNKIRLSDHEGEDSIITLFSLTPMKVKLDW